MTHNEQRMDTLQVAGLIALAGALLFLGVISFTNQLSWREPTDGIVWEQQGGDVVAASVESEGPGADAGIRSGDRLLEVDGQRPLNPEVVEVMLFARDVGERMHLTINRGGREVETDLVVGGVEDLDITATLYLAFVGLAFLMAGVFAVLRNPEGPSRRFLVLAIAFYALFALSPTTRVADPWHSVIFWLDQIARDLAPALFLYFALTFPKPKPELEEGRRLITAAVFGPGLLLLGINVFAQYGAHRFGDGQMGAQRLFAAGVRLELVYFAAAIALGILAFAHTIAHTTNALERMRLKWLVVGVAVGFFPLVAIYVPMQLLGISYPPLVNLLVLPVLLVPLSFAYGAVGFRLWDVEVILKGAITYAITIVLALSVYFATQWVLASTLGPDDNLVQTAALIATLIVAIGFAPLRYRMLDLADRIYYRDSYRGRRTLMDFGRELNSETDLANVVKLLVQRVRETMRVGRVAVLLRIEDTDHLRIVPPDGQLSAGRALSSNFSQFVAGALVKRPYLYIDDLDAMLEEYPDDREVLETEDLAYFLPLDVKGDIIGVLAIGRRLSGDFLSSDDLKVLQPLAAHLALAVDNALLYREVQRRAEELERLKEYSENIVESITAGVMVLDAGGHVQSWNRALADLHGLGPEEAVGHTVTELFRDGFCKVLDEAREKVWRGFEPLTSAYRIPLRTHDGEDRVVTLSVAPLAGEEGMVVIIDDVTERTEMESQLRQAEKLMSVGLLAAGVAHEVNTPLAGISAYVQMLQRKMPETDPRRAILEKIEKQTFRASRIVNSLLNFSRQETGEFRRVDLNNVVDETLALAEIQLRKRQIVIKTTLDDDVPVFGDPIKLQQVLMNLLLNARDAMPQGGSVHISTIRQNGSAILQVRDSGTGIDAESIDKVYDPFFTTKGIGKGTGLGLSVSYGIIQEHHGSITVDSTPGKGTVFRISLPAATDTQAAAG
jgi:two-component system NtrC family sensor kinase